MTRGIAVLLGVLVGISPLTATADKYHVTDKEKAACTEDAVRLCMNAYPSEDGLLACMKRNRASLSPTCLAVFDEGMKRRHL